MGKNIVIMVNGKSNNGKGTVAELLLKETSNEYNKIKTSLSTYIRKIAKDDFFWDGVDNEDSREFMQETYRLGTKLYPYHMAKRVYLNDIEPNLNDKKDNLIIVESLREKCNYDFFNRLKQIGLIDDLITIRVERPNFDALGSEKLKNHVSETDMDSFDFNWRIANDGSENNYLRRLSDQVIEFINAYGLKPNVLDVIIDFDNVIVDTDWAMADFYNEYYHNEIGFKPADGDDIYYYDAGDQCPLLTMEDLYGMFSSDFFWRNIRLKENAVEIINKLCYDKKYNVMICSFGDNGNKSKKAKYIKDNLYMVKETILSDGNLFSKNNISLDRVVFDDHEDNLQNMGAFNFLMFDKGYRDFNKKTDHCIKVTSWYDFYDKLEELRMSIKPKYIDTTKV